MNIEIRNQQRKYNVSQRLFKDKATDILSLCGVDDVELSVLIVNNQMIRVLNKKYRGIDSPTDVLAFPMGEEGGLKGGFAMHPRLLGDIVISFEKVDAQAKEQRHSFNRELLTLLTHGILHLLGYDHEISPLEERRMKKKESFILSKI